MATKGHLLYYPEGKHDILLGKELNDVLKSKVNSVTKITYQDLKKLRDNSKLVPGSLYRIIDYNCTTTQENTQSAGHQFDIVLLALSENKLAEEGWAMMHDNVYDVTFNDGVTKKCYIYVFDDEGDIYLVDVDTLLGFEGNINVFEIDEDNKTVQTSQLGSNVLTDEDLPYNYFQNSNLSAWKVWYCLDNDKSRFAWADDSVVLSVIAINDSYVRFKEDDRGGKFCWRDDTLDDLTWTDSETPAIGDTKYIWNRIRKEWRANGTVQNVETSGTGLPNGRGVIYRLIDEWNNDVGYDFKNIQFIRKLGNGGFDPDSGEDTWVYTFNTFNTDNENVDSSNVGRCTCHNNYIAPGKMNYVLTLPNNVLIIAEGSSITIENSGDCTVIGDCVTLKACDNCIVGIYYGTLICCNDFRVYEDDEGIYINNKKVLTNE